MNRRAPRRIHLPDNAVHVSGDRSTDGVWGPGRGGDDAALTLRDEQKALTRARIIRAAHAAIAAGGPKAANFDDIARQAGVARATVYLHFPSREALWLAMLQEDWRAQRALFDTLPSHIGRGDVSAWLDRLIAGFRARRISMSAYAVLLGSDPTLGDSLNEQRAKLLAILGRRFDAFAVADRADATRWTAAYLMLVQIEQFCQFATSEPREDIIKAGVAVLSGRIVEFVQGHDG